MATTSLDLRLPVGVKPGQQIHVLRDGKMYALMIPDGVEEGQSVQVQLPQRMTNAGAATSLIGLILAVTSLVLSGLGGLACFFYFSSECYSHQCSYVPGPEPASVKGMFLVGVDAVAGAVVAILSMKIFCMDVQDYMRQSEARSGVHASRLLRYACLSFGSSLLSSISFFLIDYHGYFLIDYYELSHHWESMVFNPSAWLDIIIAALLLLKYQARRLRESVQML